MPPSHANISAAALRQARLDAGYTQAAVAEHLGVDLMRVSVWERGLAEPRPGYLPRLAGLYRTTARQLLDPQVRDTVRGARLVRGLTVQETADLAAMPVSRYHRIERHGADLDNETLQKIATALGLDAAELHRRLTN